MSFDIANDPTTEGGLGRALAPMDLNGRKVE
jgi:hypothetical protein